jgi:hypothetical protein
VGSTTARKWWALEQTKKAHTPGPWKVHIDDNAIWVEPPNPADSVICDLRGRDAAVLTDEDEANADLIAAAPDLLKAAKLAHEFFINPHKFNPLDVERTYEAAIRKAIGAA